MSAVEYDSVAARRAIRQIAIETPLLWSSALSGQFDTPIFLKLENLQVTGSFKVRGAANRMLSLGSAERACGVVTCSSGNHGRAVAYVAEALGVPATICVPDWVDPVKLDAMRQHGAETVQHGSTYDEAERRAFEIERERGLVPVHPFDDPQVIAGQGTIGLELLEQCDGLSAVVVPVSGGGLVSGIALALKAQRPDIRVVGVSAGNARVMVESLQAGRPIAFPERPTVASALSGGIGLHNRHTFNLVQQYVDAHVLVTEREIARAISFAAREHKQVVEGGGAVGLAALLERKVTDVHGPVAVLVSGGNVDLHVWHRLVCSSSPEPAGPRGESGERDSGP